MKELKLYFWRAWSEDGRIADCGEAWAADLGAARAVAVLALGGPHARAVIRFDVEPVNWPDAPHGRQVTT